MTKLIRCRGIAEVTTVPVGVYGAIYTVRTNVAFEDRLGKIGFSSTVVLIVDILGLGMVRIVLDSAACNLFVPFATTLSPCLQQNIVLLNYCSEINVRVIGVILWRRK
jgi:hypothetical protein